MGVVVRKSSPVMVRPSAEPAEMTATITLSSFDMGLHKVPATSLLMFEHSIHEAATTVKRALSQALVYYYPFAGRIVAGRDDGELHIQCNGEGVAFVSAYASCGVKEVISVDRSAGARTILDELAIYYPDNCCGAPTDPLLLVQVTEFSCGGFILGVTSNHAVADGAGTGQFLKAVGELARGLPSPSTAPFRSGDSLPSRPPPTVSARDLMTNLDPVDELVCFDITIPSRSINRVKAEYARRFNGQPCTMFEAASAILWQCRTRAIMSDPETPSLFIFGINVRKYVGSMEGYYGNCATSEQVTATSGMVANGDIMDLVTMIKQTKDKVPDQFKKNQGNNPLKPIDRQRQPHHQLRYNMLIVSSWKNLGFGEADFGSGKAARVTPYAQEKLPFPACMMCLPHKGKDGANMLTTMVKKEHVDTLLRELERLV